MASLQERITREGAVQEDRFGYALALLGDTLVIGSDGEELDAGAVYVYTRAGSSWSLQQRLIGSSSGQDDRFGRSLALSADTLVFDTIYNPMKTRLLREAESHGAKTIGGVEMFVRQAAAQFEAWTGLPAPVDLMRQTIESRLQGV